MWYANKIELYVSINNKRVKYMIHFKKSIMEFITLYNAHILIVKIATCILF